MMLLWGVFDVIIFFNFSLGHNFKPVYVFFLELHVLFIRGLTRNPTLIKKKQSGFQLILGGYIK